MKLSQIDAYAHDHPRDIGCIRIAPEERSLAPAPRFIFGSAPDHLFQTLFSGVRCLPVSCYIIRNGRLGFDAIVSHDQTALWCLGFNHGDDFVGHALAGPDFVGVELPVRHVRGQAACIHGPGYLVYGHWLVDFLPRLAVLTWAGYDIRKISYVLPYDTPVYALQFLQAIGISPKQYIPYDPMSEQVRVDELIVPTNLRTGNRLHSLFSSATSAWVQRIAPDRGSVHPEGRVFISRAKASPSRTLDNRAIIERLAEDAGFVIVHPEDLNLGEQITIFRSARQIVGEYGSGLHGTIYGDRSLHCCALRATSHWLGFIQSSLSHALGQTTSYVFGHADAHALTYAFDIDVDNFRRALDCLDVELTGR